MKLISLLLIFISFAAFGVENYLLCPTTATCRCPENQLPMPSGISVRKEDSLTVLTCRPIVQTAVTNLEGSPSPQVICDEESADTLFDRMSRISPANCGYNFQRFNANGFRETIAVFLRKNQILCNSRRNHSMCTSAAFLAFLSELRRLKDLGLITEEKIQELSDLRGQAWKYINDQARPDLLLQELGLGGGRVIRKADFPVEGWPRQGDLLQIWREDNTGHSVVFGGYMKDPSGTIRGVCYWSANLSTNGYGKLCEPMEVVNRMIVARFNR